MYTKAIDKHMKLIEPINRFFIVCLTLKWPLNKQDANPAFQAHHREPCSQHYENPLTIISVLPQPQSKASLHAFLANLTQKGR